MHYRQPLPPEAAAILDEAVRRLARSPLYRANRKHDVFLCNSAGLFTFLTLKRDVTGVTSAAGNPFIRAANVARDRVIERSGQERSGERTLTYVKVMPTTSPSADRTNSQRSITSDRQPPP